MTTRETIMVGMSGGVDSSVSAYLLKQQGFHVEGLFMKNWEEDDTEEYCSATVDLEDATRVSEALGIRLHTVNFSAEYWDNVFEHFLNEYKSGRTPNPDVMCNREIKFKAFLDHAKTLGASRIATGHYVRCRQQDQHYHLLRGLDAGKDQSYFLYLLNQHQLSQALFPVGELDKVEVREIARELDLQVHDKKDSTGICFIGERKFSDFLKRFIPAQPGDIVSIDGDHLGQHAGLMYYTIGQRQGLGIGGTESGSELPWYVVEKRLSENQLVVAQGGDHPALLASTCEVTDLHWIGEVPSTDQLTAKIRYRQQDSSCQLLQQDNRLLVRFDDDQRAITPGQALVFYDGEVCLGGATIVSALEPAHG